MKKSEEGANNGRCTSLEKGGVTRIKASNGPLFNRDGSTQVSFDVPAMSAVWTRQRHDSWMRTGTWIEGSQSISNRFQLYDTSGHLLKEIQNYHTMYGLGMS